MKNTHVICSGGLDSVTLAYKTSQDQERALSGLISFDYGQRHKKELDYAKICADKLGVRHFIIDLTSVGAQLSGSALTDDIDVPDGHYAQESMALTIVPNRNAIMLSVGYGIAMAQDAECVALAVHGGDHFIYPDCRPDFLNAFDVMQKHALEGCADISLYAPFADQDKAAIVTEGAALNVPFEDTWSCYKGGAQHCGRCGTCVERREAFHLARVDDPTLYDDPDFWVQSVEDAKKAGAL